jgi:hypothetical protein
MKAAQETACYLEKQIFDHQPYSALPGVSLNKFKD